MFALDIANLAWTIGSGGKDVDIEVLDSMWFECFVPKDFGMLLCRDVSSNDWIVSVWWDWEPVKQFSSTSRFNAILLAGRFLAEQGKDVSKLPRIERPAK